MNVPLQRANTPPLGVEHRETTAPWGWGEPRIGSLVFGASPALARDVLPAAILACALHLGVAAWAGALGAGGSTARTTAPEVIDVEFVVRDPPPPVAEPSAVPPEPSVVPPEPSVDPAEPSDAAAEAEPRRRAKPPRASAAALTPEMSPPTSSSSAGDRSGSTSADEPKEAPGVLAASPTGSAAVFDFTAGGGPTYGGTVSATGTRGASTSSASSSASSLGKASTGPGRGRTKARAVGLRGDPECRQDWPARAHGFAGARQVVSVRVRVDPHGELADAWVERDPGYGFGAAALDCIRRKRFTPARDVNGEPVEATSPPIEVEFIRPGP